MAIDRSFEGALNKALRSLEYKVKGLSHPAIEEWDWDELCNHLDDATDLRLLRLQKPSGKGWMLSVFIN